MPGDWLLGLRLASQGIFFTCPNDDPVFVKTEVDAFYFTVLAPDIVNSGREEQGLISVSIPLGILPPNELCGLTLLFLQWMRASPISASQPSL